MPLFETATEETGETNDDDRVLLIRDKIHKKRSITITHNYDDNYSIDEQL